MTEIEKVTPSRTRAARPSTARKGAGSKTAEKAAAAGARVPADHAPAKTDVQPAGLRRIEWRQDPETKEPYVYEIDAEEFDDLDYIDAMIEMERAGDGPKGATYAYIAMKQLLGPERMELWKERETAIEGRPRFTAMMQFFQSTMEQLQKGNSDPSPAA